MVALAATATHVRKGLRVIGVDLVPERLAAAREHGVEVLVASSVDDVVAQVRDLTDGRGTDGSLDAVGMEAHGAPLAKAAVMGAARLPGAVGRALTKTVSFEPLTALRTALRGVRRGGTVSVAGVYGGMADPMPMMEIFDRG